MLHNEKPSPLASIDVLILCGGLGSRLRPLIADRPKGLALIGGRPFLDILVEDLIQHQFRRLIFCVGHLKEQIIEQYQHRQDAEYLFSQEDTPLGTGGAVQRALPLVHSDTCLVINGDSRCAVAFEAFWQFHCRKAAVASFVLTAPAGRQDGGLICINETQQIQSFAEKASVTPQRGFINAGIYLLQREWLVLPHVQAPFSLEHDVFPNLISTQPCFGFVVPSPLIDIGTPERYRQANEEYRI
ncbi:MAG: sugar phosphate nucleotidyltransferase [Candidatus Tectimicrobiota bacterium]